MNQMSPVKIWRNQKKIKKLLNQIGEIISWTVIRTPPSSFEGQAPYLVVLVKLPDRNYIGHLVDSHLDEAKVGQKVRAVLRRIRNSDPEGVISYGIKFKLWSE